MWDSVHAIRDTLQFFVWMCSAGSLYPVRNMAVAGVVEVSLGNVFEFFEQAKAECQHRYLLDRMGNKILEIIFPPEGKVRARKIVSRSRARPTGKYPSWKMGRMLQWESVNELNAYRLLDADPAAIAYHEQPLTIRFQLHGEVHTHYPDTLVQWGDSRELWEIKPSVEASRPEYVKRTRLMEAALPELGFAYRMVLAEDLAREPRLSNVQKVLRLGRPPISEITREQIRRVLATNCGLTWGAVLDGALGPNGRNHISRLILEGKIIVNLDAQMNHSTLLAWNSNPQINEKGGI